LKMNTSCIYGDNQDILTTSNNNKNQRRKDYERMSSL
jgi:hypothetical protein